MIYIWPGCGVRTLSVEYGRRMLTRKTKKWASEGGWEEMENNGSVR